MRYLVYFTPRMGNIYYRWMDYRGGEWSEWSECGKVVVFNNPGTDVVEAYAKKPGKPESAHLSTTFTVAYAGMSVAPGISVRIDKERGYQVTMSSLYDYDIYFRWNTENGEWTRWLLFYGEDLPFTEIGKYTIEARCDYEDGFDQVSVTFEVDRSTPGGIEYLTGDVNMDGAIDVDDVTVLLSHVLGNSTGTFEAELADINGDSLIDIADVTALISQDLNND